MKELNILNILNQTDVGSNLYQPRRTIGVSSEILKMNPTLEYVLSLTSKLACNHLHATRLS